MHAWSGRHEGVGLFNQGCTAAGGSTAAEGAAGCQDKHLCLAADTGCLCAFLPSNSPLVQPVTTCRWPTALCLARCALVASAAAASRSLPETGVQAAGDGMGLGAVRAARSLPCFQCVQVPRHSCLPHTPLSTVTEWPLF